VSDQGERLLADLREKSAIERFLRRDPFRNIFALADLDDRYWPQTRWHGLEADGRLVELVLVYLNAPSPVLMALADGSEARMRSLLRSLAGLLPPRAYAHVSPGLVDVLADVYRVQPRGALRKMALTEPARLATVDTTGVVALGSEDRSEVERFYAASHPGGGFQAAALESGGFVGLREGGRLVGAAGVHAFSPLYRVAARGNIATDPAFRRRGVATRVTAALCRRLLSSVDHIGLVVAADNDAAITCYEKLGFSSHSVVEACSLEARLDATSRCPA